MKYLLIFIATFLFVNAFSQKSFLEDRPLIMAKAELPKLEKEYSYLLQLDSFPDKMYWAYYLRKSIFHLYLEKDSVVEYLHFAIKDSPKTICKIIYNKENLVIDLKKTGRIADNYAWYLTDLPLETQIELRNMCNENDYMPKVKARGKVTPLEKRIISNDHDGRLVKEIDWEKQNKLDAENRRILDSLYDVHQSFIPFNKYELDAFSSVLHHSADCQWNFKWFDIWLKEDQKGNLKGGKLLGAAFDRMLTKGEGCWIDDPEGSKAIIEKLKKKYPSEFAEKYGYNSF